MKQQSWGVLILLSILSIWPIRAIAQDYVYATGSPTFGVNYPISNGNIDISNGNVHITIPLGTFQQRGNLPPISINLEYDSRIYDILNNNDGTYSWQPANVPNSMAGWRLTTGLEQGTTSYTVNLFQSGQYTCNGQTQNGLYASYTSYLWIDPNGTWHTFDTSVIQPSGVPQCTATGTGYAIDGSGYYLTVANDNIMTIYDTSGSEVFPLRKDFNGNQATIDSSGTVTDSMGRTLLTTTTNGNTIQYNVLKEGGGYNPFTVNTEPININTFFQQSDVTEFSGSLTAISGITLPDGSSYSFTYDSGTSSGNYGELESMTMPTGGQVKLYYTNYFDSYRNYNRWISEESENNGNTVFTPHVLTQCKSGEVGCREQMTVLRPSGDSKVYTLTLNDGAWDSQTDIYSGSPGSSSKLTTVTTNYNFASYPCTDPSICTGAKYIKASSNTVQLDDTGQTAQTVYTYSKPWTAKVDSVQQFDYGVSGTPSRETDYTYGYTFSNGVSLLTEVNQKLNNNSFSQTLYGYDGNGNLLNKTDGLLSEAKISYTYDSNGMKLSMTDPCGNGTCSDMMGTGHTTTYAYACNDSFLQRTTYPSTNGVTHVTQVNPDCSSSGLPFSGLPLTTTDQNNQVTTYGYDRLGRISSINYPDGGLTTYQYPSPIETIQSKLLSGSTYSTQTTTVDAYGLKSSVSLSDPAGNDTISYAYDADGRLQYTYNPQRSASSPTDGYTFTNYDALDRPAFIDPPNGNRVYIAYSGNSTTVTDENGNQKRYVFDAFQDMTQVFEPNASKSPTWETDYTYDAAGHVISITQKGDGSSAARMRTFKYDDLGRLLMESTPEAGAICYGTWNGTTCVDGYDANGNLMTKSTGRGIIKYTYDVLNRMLTKTGSNLNYQYGYDTTANFPQLQGITAYNAIGRLLGESNNVNADSIFSYDPMGRLNWQSSLTPSSLNNTGIITRATYDLAGDRTSLTYPDGRMVSNTYDSAQHLTGVQYMSWRGTSVGTPYYTATGIAPAGEITNAVYGNGIQTAASYNSRQSIEALSYATASHVLWSKQYTWAPNSQNLLKMTDQVNPVQTMNYTYDPVNRLTSATQPQSSPATAGSGTITISGSEQSTAPANYSAYSASVTAQISTQGTDTETAVPSTGFPSVALNSANAVTVTASIDYNIKTDLNTGTGLGGVYFQYSTNGGASWTSFYSQLTPNDTSYGPQNATFGPISGLSNLNQLLLRVQATATGRSTDSSVTVSADMNSPVATVSNYDSGALTVTVNGHSDTASYGAGSLSTGIAYNLATAINNDSGSPVTASATAGVWSGDVDEQADGVVDELSCNGVVDPYQPELFFAVVYDRRTGGAFRRAECGDGCQCTERDVHA